MKSKQWLILLASCLALAAAPLSGCGDTDDPSSNNGQATNNGGNNNGGTNNGGTNNGADAGNNGNPDATNNGTPDAGNDADSGNNNGTSGECDPNLNFTGQAYQGGDDPHNGGNPVEASTVTLDDAGLQAVYEATPASEDDGEAVTNDDGDTVAIVATLDPALEVDGALVIATADGNGRLWLADQNAEMLFFYAYPDGEEPSNEVRVGDKVSFSVTEVTNYGGVPEITAASGFTVDSSDNDVPYHDLTGQDVTMDTFGELVRVGGEVTSIELDSCGGNNVCYALTHGDKTVTLRSSSSFLEVGDCVTYFGPQGAFPGPKDWSGRTPAPQLDTVNYGWLFDPPSE